MPFAFGQRIDDISQTKKTFIDQFRFFEQVSRGPGLPDLFTSGQVNQIKLSLFDRPVLAVLLLNVQNGDQVRPKNQPKTRKILPRRHGVHIGSSDFSILISVGKKLHDLGLVAHTRLDHIFNEDTLGGGFPNLHAFGAIDVEQVGQTLFVNFEHGDFDDELDVISRVVNKIEHSVDNTGDDSL